MTVTISAAGRLARPAGAFLAALLVLLTAAPAGAAGTGGIEVTPDPPVVDGERVSNFRVEVPSRGEQQERFTIRNIEDGDRSARLYVAEVTRNDGNLALGEPGSSPFVTMPDVEVTLQPGEVRPASFTVVGGDLPDGEVMAAVVVEVSNGSIVQRASTLIYLEPGRQVPLPLLLVVVAVVLVLAAGAAVAALARRRATSEQAVGDGP